MATLDLELVGDRRVGLAFEQFPQSAHDELLKAIRRLTGQLEGAVLGRVPVATGDLRSIVQSFVDDSADRISGKVKVVAPDGADQAKAAALEYGAHKPFMVKAHQMKLGHFWAAAVTPRMVMVGAFSRTPDIAAHDFLRGPLDEMSGEILVELQQAIDAASAGAMA